MPPATEGREGEGLRRTGLALALLGALLALNLGPAPAAPALALVGAAAWAAAALPRAPRPARAFGRLGLALAYAALSGGAVAAFGDAATGLVLALRMAAGATAAVACAAMSREAELRELVRRAGAPAWLLELVDGALLHGRLLARTLARRQEASRLREGGLPGCALALAGGVERAFQRSEALEEVRALRSAPEPGPGGIPLRMEALSARHPEGGGLERLDLELGAGEWLAVLGASGSGKSTLLRVASGLMKPCGGRLERHGRPGGGRPDGLSALVFQDPEDQLLAATALEDAAWGLERRGVGGPEARARAREVLEALGLGHLAERSLHRLSHGERKRAALASALAPSPRLLLLDEPTAGLDACAAARLVATLERAVPDAAVLWATHELQALPSRVGRVLILEAGRAAFLGDRASALRPERLRRHGLLP